MRIALLNFIRFYGGGEKRTLRAAFEFRARGHEVTVLGDPAGELARRCEQQAIPFAPVTLKRYYSPATVRAAVREIARCRADVVVCYDESAVRVAALASRLLSCGGPRAGVKIIYYLGLQHSFKNKLFNRVVVAPRVSCFVANAEAIRREFLGFGWLPEERFRVIHDGVDPTAIFRADPTGLRAALGDAPEDVVALVVARLVPEKGHAFLLDAVSRLAPRFPRLRVWFAGEGPKEAALRAQIEALGLTNQVRLLGFRRDIPRLLRSADILCHPSRKEGAPNAVREAMAAGLPVVALAASGTPELVLDGVTGLLSPMEDTASFAANLEALVSSPELRTRMGQAGRERALTEFSEALCAERWLSLLEECVDEGRAVELGAPVLGLRPGVITPRSIEEEAAGSPPQG